MGKVVWQRAQAAIASPTPTPHLPTWNSSSTSDPVLTISIRLHLRQRPVSTRAFAFNSLHTGGASVHVWDGRGRRGGDGGAQDRKSVV